MDDADRLLYLEKLLNEKLEALSDKVEGLDRLTESKFVTHKTMLDSNAAQVSLALAAAEKAIDKADIATEKRFEGVNEFRATLTDQARTFIGRPEYTTAQKSLNDKLDIAASRLSRLEGRLAGYTSAAAIIAIVVAIALKFIQ
jgi:hypothetical protein